MFELIKALEITTSMLFNLVFANNFILCLFCFFLVIDLYFLICAVIVQILNLIAELAIHIRILNKEPKAEIDTVTIEAKIRVFNII